MAERKRNLLTDDIISRSIYIYSGVNFSPVISLWLILTGFILALLTSALLFPPPKIEPENTDVTQTDLISVNEEYFPQPGLSSGHFIVSRWAVEHELLWICNLLRWRFWCLLLRGGKPPLAPRFTQSSSLWHSRLFQDTGCHESCFFFLLFCSLFFFSSGSSDCHVCLKNVNECEMFYWGVNWIPRGVKGNPCHVKSRHVTSCDRRKAN